MNTRSIICIIIQILTISLSTIYTITIIYSIFFQPKEEFGPTATTYLLRIFYLPTTLYLATMCRIFWLRSKDRNPRLNRARRQMRNAIIAVLTITVASVVLSLFSVIGVGLWCQHNSVELEKGAGLLLGVWLQLSFIAALATLPLFFATERPD